MGHRAAAWLAWSLWALCVGLAALAFFLNFYTPPTGRAPPFRELAAVAFLVYPTFGALVASRRPKNAVGYILLGLGIVLEVQVFAAAYTDYARAAPPGPLPGNVFMSNLTPWAIGPA